MEIRDGHGEAGVDEHERSGLGPGAALRIRSLGAQAAGCLNDWRPKGRNLFG